MPRRSEGYFGFRAGLHLAEKLGDFCESESGRLGKRINTSDVLRQAVASLLEEKSVQVERHRCLVKTRADEMKATYKVLPSGRRELLHVCFDNLLEHERALTAIKSTLSLGLKYDRNLSPRVNIETTAYLLSDLIDEILDLDGEVRTLLEAHEKEQSEAEPQEETVSAETD